MKNAASIGWKSWARLAAGALLVWAASLSLACDREEEAVRLTSRERIQADTTASKLIDSLRPVLDSVCTADYQRLLQHTLDSLIKVRREEEAKLRSRILQQQRLQEQQ